MSQAVIQDVEATAEIRDIKYTLTCSFCSKQIRENNDGHLAHRAACEAEWDAKSESEKAEMERRRQEVAAALPRQQNLITTIDKCKAILGRDQFTGMLVRPGMYSTNSGIIIDPSHDDGTFEYINVFLKSRFAKVLKVSALLGVDRHNHLNYPFLEEWKERLEDGEEIYVRVKSDAGVPFEGSNREAILYLHGSDVMYELPEPVEADD